MSGGPGSMQRRIVEAMATRHGTINKASTRRLRLHPVIGGDFVQVREKSKREGYGYYLSEGMHDMRRVSQEVKPRGGENAFEASFSRALRTLEARGLIEFPREVPVYTDEVDATERLDDGLYLLSPKPYRFARLIEWRLKEREPSIE
jgi:hypothetical protein